MTVIISDGAAGARAGDRAAVVRQRHHDLQRPVWRQRLDCGAAAPRPTSRSCSASRGSTPRCARSTSRSAACPRRSTRASRATTASACATTTSRCCCAARSPAVAPSTARASSPTTCSRTATISSSRSAATGPAQPPTELWPIPWTWVQEITDGDRDARLQRVPEHRHAVHARCPRDVVHYQLMGGRSPLEPLRRTLGIEDAAMDWHQQTLDNGPSLRGAFTTANSLQDRTIPRLRAELEELYSGPGGKTLGIFDQGLKFNSISQSAADAALIETRKASREETAASLRDPGADGRHPRPRHLLATSPSCAARSTSTRWRRTCTLDRGRRAGPAHRARADVEARRRLQRVRPGRDPQARPAAEAQSIMLLTSSSGTTSTNDNRKLKRLDPIGDPADPENPYNRPRVPANLLDPCAGARRRSAHSIHAALVAGAMQRPDRPGRPRKVTSVGRSRRPRASSGRSRPAVRAEGEPTATDLWIYDVIGDDWYDSSLTAKELCQTIAAIDTAEIVLHLSSPGGSVSDGLAIYNALVSHPAKVTSRVEGWTASMATIVALAGSTRRDVRQRPVHDPQPAHGRCGNAAVSARAGRLARPRGRHHAGHLHGPLHQDRGRAAGGARGRDVPLRRRGARLGLRHRRRGRRSRPPRVAGLRRRSRRSAPSRPTRSRPHHVGRQRGEAARRRRRSSTRCSPRSASRPRRGAARFG